MRALLVFFALGLFSNLATAQKTVSFPTEDGGVIFADLYGTGDRAVVLAHGAQFNKESWAAQAKELEAAGFRVLAIDFRGYGKSHGPGEKEPTGAPLRLDVLAAVDYLHKTGSKDVSVVGASMGAMATGDASIASKPGEIDRIVLLSLHPSGPASQLKSPVLFIISRDDRGANGPRLPGVQKAYDEAPQPKKLVILDGSAHAQFLFKTDKGPQVMREIIAWLKGGRN